MKTSYPLLSTGSTKEDGENVPTLLSINTNKSQSNHSMHPELFIVTKITGRGGEFPGTYILVKSSISTVSISIVFPNKPAYQ